MPNLHAAIPIDACIIREMLGGCHRNLSGSGGLSGMHIRPSTTGKIPRTTVTCA
jgi:hypothetical protein